MKQGEKLKLLLKEKGLKQYEFAIAINESLSQVNKVLNSQRNVSSSLLEKIIIYFPDLDLNWFFKEDVKIRNIFMKDGKTYGIHQNVEYILTNMEEEIKILKKKYRK